MGQHFPGVFDHRRQKLVFERRQMDFLTIAVDESGSQINTKVTNGDGRRFRSDPVSMTQGGSSSGQEFSDSKGLGHVVVRTVVERLIFCDS